MQRLLRSLAGLLIAAAVASAAASRDSTASPVEKVVNLLKDLKTKAEQDGEHEQKIYNKFACWCDKAMKAKADAIDQAKLDLRALSQEILKLKGKIATLESEIEELAKAMKENEEMVAEATALREKENGAFQAETAEMKQAIAAMQSATEVLVNATSLLQHKEPALVQQGASLSRAAVRSLLNAVPVNSKVSQKDLSLLSEFLEAKQGYAPQSMTVQGILKDMYDTFASDLESTTVKEATANKNFEELVAEKATEMKQMKVKKAKREEQKAEAEADLATATELFDATGAQRKADIKFFDASQASCIAKADEWTDRKAMRKEEIEGIEEALGILTTDDARALFASAIKPGKETGADAASFLQVASASDEAAAMVPQKAYAAIKAVGSKSLRMAQLAVTIRTAKVGHFDKVIDAINEMIQTIKDEGAADIDKRDQCKEEYQKIESTIKDLEWKIKNNVATIDKLTALIEKREAQKAKTIEDIAEVDSQVTAMNATRKEENSAFLAAKAEDVAAIDLLTAARTALAKFYKKNTKLLQQEPAFEVGEFQAPEATFSDKGSRKGQAKGILSIMTYLIDDLKDEITNGFKAEAEAQLQYEEALEAANKLRAELVDKKVGLEEAIAQRGLEKSDEEVDLTGNKGDLSSEQTYKAQIKPDCDWIIGAFSERAKRRAAELEGLGAAKAYLAGASLLQTKARSTDGEALSRVGFLSLSPARRV